MSISKKIMDSLQSIDESLDEINEALPFRWSGEEDKWTDKWVSLLQKNESDLVGTFKGEVSIKLSGVKGFRSAWILQFSKLSFVGVTTSKKGGEIRYVIEGSTQIKKNSTFSALESGNLSNSSSEAILLPSNIKGIKQLKSFLSKMRDSSSETPLKSDSRAELRSLSVEERASKIAENMMKSVSSLKYKKLYRIRDGYALRASSHKDEYGDPVTTPGSEGVTGIFVIFYGRNPSDRSNPVEMTEFNEITSSQKGAGGTMVREVVDSMPEGSFFRVHNDWSGGFWSSMKSKFKNYKWIL